MQKPVLSRNITTTLHFSVNTYRLQILDKDVPCVGAYRYIRKRQKTKNKLCGSTATTPPLQLIPFCTIPATDVFNQTPHEVWQDCVGTHLCCPRNDTGTTPQTPERCNFSKFLVSSRRIWGLLCLKEASRLNTLLFHPDRRNRNSSISGRMMHTPQASPKYKWILGESKKQGWFNEHRRQNKLVFYFLNYINFEEAPSIRPVSADTHSIL